MASLVLTGQPTGLLNKNILNPEDSEKLQHADPLSNRGCGPNMVAPLPTADRTQAAHTAIKLDSLEEIKNVHILESRSPATKTTITQLEQTALQHYTMGSPRSDMLLHLISLNFTRALIENTLILGLKSEQLHDDAISPFNTAGPWPDVSLQTLPIALQPTAIQLSVPHHPWLDLLPIPQMRDNLILAGDFEEETQLCLDMKGDGTPQSASSGIIVWSDPWDPAGWEVTEPFARYWSWVIRDCSDLAHSTNQWRAKRNERPLFSINQ